MRDYLDWIWPTLDDDTSHLQAEVARQKAQLVEIEARVKALPSDKDSLEGLMASSAAMLDKEQSRRASVDGRLLSMIGLMSIAATVVLGTLLSFVTDKDIPDVFGAKILVPLGCIYLAAQLVSALKASLKGLRAIGYEEELPEEAIPGVGMTPTRFLKLRIRSALGRLVAHTALNNTKVSQLNLAQCAVRNFLAGLLVLALFACLIAMFRPASKPADCSASCGKCAVTCTSPPPPLAASSPVTHVTLQRLLTVGPFPKGRHEIGDVGLANCLRKSVADARIHGSLGGWEIVGRVDKQELKRENAVIYGTNQALAMSRATWVREQLEKAIPEFESDHSLISVGGATSLGKVPEAARMDADRAVDVFVLLDSTSKMNISAVACGASDRK